MREPKPPASEHERLTALARYDVLDTAPELAYDEIVKLAAYICGTPIALVSLIDEHRQWFKARVGLDAEETPRELAFCGHVVEQGKLLVVEARVLDDRFHDNPLVTGDPHVVFYAGAPLETAAGHTLGSLCVIDREARTLSAEQLEMLEALSHLVIRQLELRVAERAVEQARAAAESARRIRQRFFEVSLDMLGISNFEGHFLELNPAWTKTLGWSTEELCARPFLDFVHPDDRERTIAEAAALYTGEHLTVKFVNRYQTKSGEYRWLEWCTAPDTENQLLLGVARDITEAKVRERELLEARLAAEQASEAKSDFLAKMSHELRTPLNSVIGFTNLLRRNKKANLDQKDLLYLEKIGKNGIHLLSLINDLLDLSKIEAGKTELDIVDVELETLCAAVRDKIDGAISAAGNRLRIDAGRDLAPIRADARRLEQILINLLGNANKFTDDGCIELYVHESRAHPGRADRIDVIDSGIGIAPDQLDLVFEAFRQASEGEGRTHDGTGLGLAISRSLAQLHGFELGAVSELGKGATFYVQLWPDAPAPRHRPPREPDDLASEVSRLRPRPKPARSPAAGSISGGRTILLIEDDSDARLLVANAVEQLGARVVTADSGASGFVIAEALRPDLIVLDLALPDVHGREVIRRLSSDPNLRQIPVVVFSAHVEPIAGLRSLSVLEKPSNPDELAATIARHLGPRRRVLVVDDDGDTRELLGSVLAGMQIDALEAGDGQAALELLRRERVDLVLLDICMPTMSGFEFLAALRADPALRDTPVIVCTAVDLDPGQERDAKSDAQAVIRKGFDLQGRIEEVVHSLFREAGSP